MAKFCPPRTWTIIRRDYFLIRASIAYRNKDAGPGLRSLALRRSSGQDRLSREGGGCPHVVLPQTATVLHICILFYLINICICTWHQSLLNNVTGSNPFYFLYFKYLLYKLSFKFPRFYSFSDGSFNKFIYLFYFTSVTFSILLLYKYYDFIF